MKVKFFKIFGFLGFVSSWASAALNPDEDGVVRITMDELADLAEGMCQTFGWTAEIVVPQDTITAGEELEG